MRKLVRVIDAIGEYTGKVARWACVAIVLVLVYEVVSRYIFNSPTIWVMDTAMMLGSTIAILGWVYTHNYHGHIRIDILYTHWSIRTRAIVDVICTVFLFFPLVIVLIYTAGSRALFAWSMGEVLTEGGYWYPPAFPVRVMMFIGLILFAFQGLAHFIRDLYFLVRSKPL